MVINPESYNVVRGVRANNKIKKHYNLSVFYDYLNVSQKFKRFFIIGNNF